MSKIRCSKCGASHSEGTHKCRLCGYDLTGSVQEILPQKEARREGEGRNTALSRMLVLGVVALLLVGGAALALGVSGGSSVVRTVTGNIPGLDEIPDGWQAVEDPLGGFVAELPGEATQTTLPFPLAADGELTVWTAWIGNDTRLQIAYATVDESLAETTPSLRRRTAMLGDAALADLGGRVRARDETTFRGDFAYQYDVVRFELNGKDGRAQARVWIQDDTFWAVSAATSLVSAQSQLTRVLQSLRYRAAASESATTG